MEPIPFYTGRQVSSENPTVIPAGTAVASFTAAQGAAKCRVWEITAAASPANLPVNLYRASVVVDNSAGDQVMNVTQNSQVTRHCPIATITELQLGLDIVSTEAFSVVPAGTSSAACIVTERSFN